jgi:hypothetical protein
MALPTLAPVELRKPEKGEDSLTHDGTFTAIDDALTTMRDIANRGIDALNHAGAGLPRLPEGDLYGLLIAPLTGDYAVIQQNTAACLDVRDALDTWGDNILRISVAVAPSWGGEAATAYLLRINALGLGARAVGEAVRAGAVVFDEIAIFSERIGIQVEKLLVELGKTLLRLGRRLLAKLGGPGAWAAFAAELVLKGLDAVMDIIDDVKAVIELIGALRDLYDAVVEWVSRTRHRLSVLHDLPGLMAR